MGLNSTQVKGFLTKMMYLRQQEKLRHRCQLKLTTYSPSFPTCMSNPGSVTLLCSTVLRLPHFLFGLQQQAEHEVSKPCSCSLAPLGIQQLSHLERFSHGPDNPPLQSPIGLTTRFFSPTPKIIGYMYEYFYGYGYGYNDSNKKVQRKAE
jgi:hypothetical protein